MAAQRRRQSKKLIEAARWFAGVRDDPPEPFAVDASVIEAMEAWGAPPEQIAAVYARIEADKAPKPQETFGVYAENMPAAQAFLDLRTQMNGDELTVVMPFADRLIGNPMLPALHGGVIAGFNGQRTGLNYAAVLDWLALFYPKTKTRQQLMKDLQLMELAVLQADHELRQQEE